MAFINSVLNLLATKPNDLWVKIVDWIQTFIPSYAWAILFFTLLIKFVLLPMDFLQKKTTRKNMEMQRIMAPEMEKLQKKYGNNKQLLNQKQMELYKKNNYNLVGSCLVMLVSLVLTLVVFITLWNSLNRIATYRVVNQYEQLEIIYNDTSLTDEEKSLKIEEKFLENQKENSWLWVKNIWMADSPLKKNIPTFKEYANMAGLNKEERASKEETYNKIMAPLSEKYQRVNGYFILPILVVLATVLSQLLMQPKKNKKKKEIKTEDGLIVDKDKNQNQEKPVDPSQAQGKLMLILIPILMGWLTISYNVVFALYLLASSLFSAATTPLINLIVDKLSKNKREKLEKKKNKDVSYRRKI